MTGERLIHLIDDDDAVRDSLAFLLRTSGFRVTTYESGLRFLQEAADLNEGCIITDVRMPGVTGLELTERLKQRGTRIPVIVVTGHADVHLAIQALKVGAADFIEKPFEEEEILQAIELALEGPEAQGASQAQATEFAGRIESLSALERRVLDQYLEGKQNEEVARVLELDLRAVEASRATLMAKMKAGNFSDLVRLALLAERGR